MQKNSLSILDVLNGYVIACEQRTDLFTDSDISIIFGNLKEIFDFQQTLLDDLEYIYKNGKFPNFFDFFFENNFQYIPKIIFFRRI